MRKRDRKITMLKAVLAIASAASARAHAAIAQDSREIEAAITYRIAQFVNYPHQDRKPSLDLCVTRNDPMDAYLHALRGQPIGTRTLVVRSVDGGASSYRDCDIAFLGAGGSALARSLGGLGILTIGEGEDFLARGGMIGLARSGRQIRFRVNYGVTARAGIKVSSKLLRLAMEVVR